MTSHATSLRLTRTAAAALGAGLLLSGCSLTDGPKRTASADATVSEAVTAVELTEARAGSIEVVPGTGPGVTVRRTVHYRGDTEPTPGQQVSGGVLTFTDGCSDTCFIDYRLEVPASAEVRLGNSSGKITVAGVAAADLTSESGAVEVDRIAGPLKIRTSSGAITATGLAGPSADIRSDSGDTRLDFAQAPASVAAESSSGDVTLKVPAAAYRVAVSTTSGAREVSLPTDPAAASALSAKTTSGDVRISAAG
ncbi:DUF4097 family beta strand repeat-containing protein [Streptomyces sp. NBC_01408]|uniref:DUF4097 family beta strand repeat-containing protein n=1 Tax=Streptomyces sp. NBC_01408 TaxID=2903855 RepID=UPI00225ADA58|nr:DUF4097 family beta strand repeat-containing protein [Streptomyces sp. NBC_01408]MCX4691030.1 DUF4097 domain-containing protein [Streptomyces sp. NBC_01408]